MAFAAKISYHDTLESTMDEARRLAEGGAPEGTVVQAGEQTGGRGRFGNGWVSPHGNLYMTLVLKPDMPVQDCAQMSFAAALALADTLEIPDTMLKWPNDVLVGGKKIAGILLEMGGSGSLVPGFLLVGIGLNIASAPAGATSMTQHGGAAAITHVRDELLENINHWYDRWQAGAFADIRAAWLNRAYGLNMPIHVRFSDRTVDGIFEGIDDAGNLLLCDEGGQPHIINSGAVHFTAPKG